MFRELLRERRASRVAESLGLSQPAISHALTRLRDLFEDPLFVRRPHGFEPTRRALELGPQIEALIGLAGEALNPNAGFDPARSTRLFRIGAPDFVTGLIGAELINRFRVAAPRAYFAIGHVAEEDAFKALRQGEVDFAVGRFGAARPGYVVEPLFEDVYCVAARQGHPRVSGSIDVATWRAVGHIFAWNRSETGEDDGDDDNGQVVALAAVPHWLTALTLVAATDGIATAPRKLVERHADRLGLQVLDMPFPPKRIVVSVMRRRGVADPGADWFLDEIRAAVAA